MMKEFFIFEAQKFISNSNSTADVQINVYNIADICVCSIRGKAGRIAVKM